MLRAGKKPPQIEDLGSRVRASLSGGIGNDAKSIDAMKLAEAIQRSPLEAQEVLARLADGESALLEATRRTLRKPFPTYRLQNQPLVDLARAVTYRRRTLDGIDAKVVDNVSEYGFVTNKTLQRLLTSVSMPHGTCSLIFGTGTLGEDRQGERWAGRQIRAWQEIPQEAVAEICLQVVPGRA